MKLKVFSLVQGRLQLSGIREPREGDAILEGSTSMSEFESAAVIDLREAAAGLGTPLSVETVLGYLEGIVYPKKKAGLLKVAEDNDAPEHVITALNKFADKEYKAEADITAEFEALFDPSKSKEAGKEPTDPAGPQPWGKAALRLSFKKLYPNASEKALDIMVRGREPGEGRRNYETSQTDLNM